jgi:hypothetical protein
VWLLALYGVVFFGVEIFAYRTVSDTLLAKHSCENL